METRCTFWLPKKNRVCANTRLGDSLFCGNHNSRSEEQRVPCPLDPSHSVLQENLEAHIKRCPLLKQIQALTVQPFFEKGINSSRDDEEEEEEEKPTSSNYGSSDLENTSSEMKRNAIYELAVPEFFKLIRKIESIHRAICLGIQDSYKIPKACDIWVKNEQDRKLPFQEKHVQQQASILGNLEEFGVLENHIDSVESCDDSSKKDIGVSAVVEFGAGRGYLTQMLADCYGIKKVFLVERKSYKLKADRSLRQKESLILERLRIDIEDLKLNGVESLKGVPFLAIGKHLCGPATDLTLRCCLPRESSNHYLRGLAIATCCHHLCQWKQYINKRYLLNLGITKEQFHAISWFTSWAVDADHGSDFYDAIDRGLNIYSLENEDNGVDLSGVEQLVRKMKAVERAVLGFMCKEIIDMGRLMWIKEHGKGTQLVKYVPYHISPENHLLVAKCTNHM